MNFHFLETSKEQGRKRKQAMKVLLNQHILLILTMPPPSQTKVTFSFSILTAQSQVFILTTDLGKSLKHPSVF